MMGKRICRTASSACSCWWLSSWATLGIRDCQKYIPLLSYCRSEYDGAVALARTKFENARARRDIPRFDDVDAMLELCAIFTFEITAVHASDCVDVKMVGCHFVSLLTKEASLTRK